jgi:collagenase-like PrtC family protease
MCQVSGRTAETNPVLAIVEAYKSLRDDEAALSLDDEKLYFELALNLTQSGYHSLGAEALTNYSNMIAAKGVDYFRPSPDPEIIPDPEAVT